MERGDSVVDAWAQAYERMEFLPSSSSSTMLFSPRETLALYIKPFHQSTLTNKLRYTEQTRSSLLRPNRCRRSPRRRTWCRGVALFAGHHQTMAEGRGASEHETSHSNSPRASGHRSSFRGAKSEARAPLSSLLSRVFREISPPQGPVYEFTRIDQGGQIDQSTGRQTGN